MKKFTKKLLAIIATAVISSSIGCVTAFASNYSYSFSVSPSVNYGADFSAGNPKDDNEQTAYVYTTSGNIISSDLFYMAVYTDPVYESNYRVTNWSQITSNNGRYLINYTTYRGKGTVNYLCGDTDRYGVNVSGNWYS